MLRLCFNLLTRAEGSLKLAVIQALLALAESCSGQEGCAYAGADEINVIIDALYSPIEIVREVALKVCITTGKLCICIS